MDPHTKSSNSKRKHRAINSHCSNSSSKAIDPNADIPTTNMNPHGIISHSLPSHLDSRIYRTLTTNYQQDQQSNSYYQHKPEFPLARIKKLMKFDPNVNMISSDSPLLFSKAIEIFIADLTSRAFLNAMHRTKQDNYNNTNTTTGSTTHKSSTNTSTNSSTSSIHTTTPITIQRDDVIESIKQSECLDFLQYVLVNPNKANTNTDSNNSSNNSTENNNIGNDISNNISYIDSNSYNNNANDNTNSNTISIINPTSILSDVMISPPLISPVDTSVGVGISTDTNDDIILPVSTPDSNDPFNNNHNQFF